MSNLWQDSGLVGRTWIGRRRGGLLVGVRLIEGGYLIAKCELSRLTACFYNRLD